MVALKRSEMRLLDTLFQSSPGYVLNFSDRTLAEFFEDELGIDIDDTRYHGRGTSKMNRLRAFVDVEEPHLVAGALRRLFQYRMEISTNDPDLERHRELLENLLSRIVEGNAIPARTGLSRQVGILNFDTVQRDIDRALEAAERDPESAVTSASSTLESVCRSILVELGQPLPAKKDIRSLFRDVAQCLGLGADRADLNAAVAEDVKAILGGLATIAQGIGALRTKFGDAHGRGRGYPRIDGRIADLAINAASTVSLFLIETWQKRYPNKQLRRQPEA
jgi:hypothetical protein